MDKLNEMIKNKGIRKSFIAEQLGITTRGLANKLSGKTEFLPSEITIVVKVLGMKRAEMIDIFFPNL